MSGFDLEQLQTDAVKEEEGVWFPLLDLDDLPTDGEILVASASNEKAAALTDRLRRRYSQGFRSPDHLSPEILRKIDTEVLSQTILRGWKNLRSGGKELAYSEEAARKALEANKHFRGQVVRRATDLQAFRTEAVEEGKKPSAK